MSNAVSTLKERAKGQAKKPGAVKVARYSVVSAVSLGVTAATQFITLLILESQNVSTRAIAPIATITAAVAGAIPSYYLNRAWVWGKTGKSHMRKEVIPFWIMAAIGLLAGLGATSATHALTSDLAPTLRSAVTTFSLIVSYGILWLGKFVIFNKFLFASRPQDLDPVLDGRSGIPT